MDTEEYSNILQLIAVRKAAVNELQPTNSVPMRLNLPRWTAIQAADDLPRDVAQVQSALQYILDIATQNNLHHTTAVRKLVSAIATLNRITPATEMSTITLKERVSFENWSESRGPSTQILQLAPDLDLPRLQLAQYAQYNFPIFNIWDGISMIYTLCVEPIESDLQAELHLYQFRAIMCIFQRHWYFRRIAPTTGVAT